MPENDDGPDRTRGVDPDTDPVRVNPQPPKEAPEPEADKTIRIGGDLLDEGTRPNVDSGTDRFTREPEVERTQAISAVPESAGPDSAGPDSAGPDSAGPDSAAPESEAERTQAISAVPGSAVPESAVPESEAERTQSIQPVVGQDSGWATATSPTTGSPTTEQNSGWARLNAPATEQNPPWAQPAPGSEQDTQWAGPEAAVPPQRGNSRRSLTRAGIVAAAVLGLLTLLYVGDVMLNNGKVPRGTVVAGIPIGGMSNNAAEDELRERLGPSLDEPIQVQAGDATASIQPEQAGLRMDWAATVKHAGSPSLNPFTRLTSLFSTRDVVPVSHGDRARLSAALTQVKPKLDRPSTEGAIRFEGTKPIAVEPVTGRQVNIAGATDAVLAEWAGDRPVQVPFSERPVSTTEEGVQKALKEVAEPAVSAPVTVRGEGMNATLRPEAIARALRFEPDGQGGLEASVAIPIAAQAVQPQLAQSIVSGKDARIVVSSGTPVVEPSVDGHGVNWKKSFDKLIDVLTSSKNRTVQAIYEQQPAKFTTEQANALGIHEIVSEFTTNDFETASGVNIKRVAEQVNGAIVQPGETFSLNGHTGKRGTAQGYIESGIIEDGRPAKAVGGGISQFATTLFNASYFAGMKDVEHKEHSYYISRYPEGREATVFQNPDGSSVIDVKFKNTSQNGIFITTSWTPSSITVQFWSTKQYDISSDTSKRSDPTQPTETVVPPGEPCSPSSGAPGFTVYNTRTIRNIVTGETTTEEPERTVYDPEPIVHCGARP